MYKKLITFILSLIVLITLFYSCKNYFVLSDSYYSNQGLIETKLSFQSKDSSFQIIKVGDLINDTLIGNFSITKNKIHFISDYPKKVEIEKKDTNRLSTNLQFFSKNGDLLENMRLVINNINFISNEKGIVALNTNFDKNLQIKILGLEFYFVIPEHHFNYKITLTLIPFQIENIKQGKISKNGKQININSEIFYAE